MQVAPYSWVEFQTSRWELGQKTEVKVVSPTAPAPIR